MTELETAAARGPTAAATALPITVVVPVAAKPVRPTASLLDIPPPSEERVEGVIASPPLYRRSSVLRYGIGGTLALVVIAVGIAVFDRPTVNPAAPPSQTATAGAEATKPVSATPAPAAPENVATAPHGAPELVAAADSSSAEIKRLAVQAAMGDAQAEYELGQRYSTGKDVPRDDRLAAKWFESAASRGLAPAQYNLGVLYERGLGVEKNPKNAFFWYHSAAEQNYARAEHNLATMYATGSGVPQNYDEAASWFARAAEAGITESLYSLGLMYEHGFGAARDTAKARGYYERAAAAGSADARVKLASLGNLGNAGQKPDAARMAVAARLAGTVAPGAGPGSAQSPGSDRALDRRETAELQRMLARLDFSPGSADGAAGRRTVAAIKLYQEFAGLPVDGKATRGLLDDVRDVSRALGRQPRPARR